MTFSAPPDLDQAKASAGDHRRRFQAGGTVGDGAIYIERSADRELFDALRRGELCYVLSTRQIGKSSLRLRVSRQLRAEQLECASVDLGALGADTATPVSWYLGIASEIAEQLGLEPPDDFWDEHWHLGPVHCWLRWLEDVVLVDISAAIVLFLDEIDATLSLPFSRDDFFTGIRAFVNRRAERPANARLTFCLLGVATPRELVSDPTRTPFNIGRSIRLDDFTRAEARGLRAGLDGLVPDPDALLDAIFAWTSGHPYMTQRLCADLTGELRGLDVDDAVARRFLDQARTEDPNLRYAERCLDAHGPHHGPHHRPAHAAKLLGLYKRLLEGERIAADSGDPVQLALRLTGLSAERSRPGGPPCLAVRNRIFGHVFDRAWVRAREEERAITEPLVRWAASGRKDDFLVGGAALAELTSWADGREDLSTEERAFLSACVGAECQKRSMRRLLSVLAVAVTLLGALALVLLWQMGKEEQARIRAQQEVREKDARRLAAQAAKELAEGELQRARLLAVEAALAARASGRPAGPAVVQALGDTVRGPAVAQEVLVGHGGAVLDAAFSPDGRSVATVSADGTARLFRPGEREAPLVLRGHGLGVVAVAFNRDGSRLATASMDGTVRLWHADGHEDRALAARGGAPASVAFSPDGSRVVAGMSDGTIHVWRVDIVDEPPLVVPLGERVIRRAVFNHDGGRILATAISGTVYIVRADGQGSPMPLEGLGQGIEAAEYAPRDDRIVLAAGDGTARVLPAAAGPGPHEPVVLRGHAGPVRCAAFSADGTEVITASADHTARIFRADGKGVPRVLDGHEGTVTRAAFSRDGKSVVTASEDGTTRVWRLDAPGEPLLLHGHAGPLTSVAVSPDGGRIATAGTDKTARVFRADGSGEPLVLQGHEDHVLSADFSPDGARLVTGSADRTARVWRVDGKGQPLVLGTHDDRVVGVAFSPDGTRIVTTSWNGILRIFEDGGQGDPILLRDERAGLLRAAFSPDGKHIVATSGPSVKVWPADGRGAPRVIPSGYGDRAIAALAVSPDGNHIAIAALDEGVRLLRTDGEGEPFVLSGLGTAVRTVAFSSDSARVVAVSSDGSARVLPIDGQGEPLTLLAPGVMLTDAVFTPDATRVVTATNDGTARVFSIAADPLMSRACAYAGRNFTREEWAQLMPDVDYRTTCHEWKDAPVLDAGAAPRRDER
ncbi:AAA-like domain-containing protein [Sorangium cellulosum]|uniref:AAA-like domain-containing protein n=1 Tax=Sorangium cellulosum TaxID=56 RepID=UPI000CF372B6|nr:AAA-like domain-containing protein [Sorangium cellulosum]